MRSISLNTVPLPHIHRHTQYPPGVGTHFPNDQYARTHARSLPDLARQSPYPPTTQSPSIPEFKRRRRDTTYDEQPLPSVPYALSSSRDPLLHRTLRRPSAHACIPPSCADFCREFDFSTWGRDTVAQSLMGVVVAVEKARWSEW